MSVFTPLHVASETLVDMGYRPRMRPSPRRARAKSRRPRYSGTPSMNRRPLARMGARHGHAVPVGEADRLHYGGTRNGMVISRLARIKDRVISAMETRIGFFS